MLVGTLDTVRGADGDTGGDVGNNKARAGLLIVSGGNELRSGAYAGQAAIAATIAALGYPVFRYDRRGVGDSEGVNEGFESSHDDIAAALIAFRAAVPDMTRVVAFGNCDAASALVLFHHALGFSALGIDSLVLANPWVIEAASNEVTDDVTELSGAPNAAAIRARYWARIKNPHSLVDLISGKIDLKKLASGLVKAAAKKPPSSLEIRIATALASARINVKILIAKRDTTAQAFIGAWSDHAFIAVRENPCITLHSIDSPSHSFAGAVEKAWLIDQILGGLSQG